MNDFRIAAVVFVICVAVSIGQTAVAQEGISSQYEQFFESKIRPALIKYCYECHSIDSGMTRGGLLVDSRDGLLQGGESGPAIDLNDYEASPLWTAIHYEDYEMPPSEPMPQNVIDDFEKWFEMGLPDPRVRKAIVVANTLDVASGKSHWAFQLPVADAGQSIDEVVNSKQSQGGTEPVDAAPPATLLRRLNFDLVGLPPTVQEIQAFTQQYKNNPQAAVRSKVDQLLESPQYGERWGRHWMDVVRFAESSGNGNFTYPHAWRYRDYVIDAFNKDTPYDQFIAQQLAGDLLPAKTDRQWQENLIATGFLAVGIKDHGERNPRVFEMELVDEQIDTTTQAFLGLTVSCARCHDHKFDPIPTVDYYSMAGIFTSTDTLYGTVFGQQNHQPRKLLELPLKDKTSTTKSLSTTEIEETKQRIQEIKDEVRMIRAKASRPGGEQPQQRQMVAFRNQIARLEGMLKTVDNSGKPFTFAMGVQDSENPSDTEVLLNGDVEKKAQVVPRGFLQILSDVPSKTIATSSSGRRELADWIGSDKNPLTSRVMVNRIWMHLLGTPLVESPNNFGVTAQSPSNPELLDLLAVKFVAADWSVKSLIREIVLSDTYRQSTAFDRSNDKIDPDNKTYWRANSRQLDAEALRDAMLAASALLEPKRPLASEVSAMGDGRMGRLFDKNSFDPTNVNRSVYLPIIRDDLPEALALFDFADPNATQGRRETTNVPSQSLYLMNSDYVTYVSQQMAINLSENYRSPVDQVMMAFLKLYGRVPTGEEVNLSKQFFRTFDVAVVETKRTPASGESRASARRSVGRNNGRQNANSQRRQQMISRRMRMAQNRGDRDTNLQGRMNDPRSIEMRKQNPMRGRRRPEAMDDGKGMSGGNRGGGRGQRRGLSAAKIPKLDLTTDQQRLAVFCQSLMASAEFRILD